MACKQSYEELLTALRTIRDECAFHASTCAGCPLATDDFVCGVTGQKTSLGGDYDVMPRKWIVQNPVLLKKKGG